MMEKDSAAPERPPFPNPSKKDNKKRPSQN